MKARDLMQGDWVYQALYKDAKITNKGHGWKKVRATRLPFDEDWAIEPIPLTEDILKANGFKKGCYINGYFHPLFPFRIIVTKEDRQSYFDVLFNDGILYYCKYVHELQHALHLCGLTHLADNLKIE